MTEMRVPILATSFVARVEDRELQRALVVRSVDGPLASFSLRPEPGSRPDDSNIVVGEHRVYCGDFILRHVAGSAVLFPHGASRDARR